MKISEFQGKYRFLSNFWPATVVLDEEKYPSVEHAYQAAKTTNVWHRSLIRSMTAGQAKRYTKKKVTLRKDWDQLKLTIMEDLVRQKFQHPDLRQKLLDTEDAELVEGNLWGDIFWGVCKGIGQNHLGKILMKVREECRGT